MESSLAFQGSAAVEVRPADISRDWRQRWQLIQNRLLDITTPASATSTMSGDATHEWRDRVHSFYILAYHLKDILVDAGALTGIPKHDVENAITQTPALALLADLANLDKHGKLDIQKHPPRSGHVPVIKNERGRSLDDRPGWVLVLEIEHNGTTYDGLDVARDAVKAWETQLRQWNLI